MVWGWFVVVALGPEVLVVVVGVGLCWFVVSWFLSCFGWLVVLSLCFFRSLFPVDGLNGMFYCAKLLFSCLVSCYCWFSSVRSGLLFSLCFVYEKHVVST